MRKLLLILLISTFFLSAKAQNFSVGDSAIYSLITCSPGQEVYAKFGHTAIRINDPKSGTDVVFNYGIFSFETDNFYYKFIKGETDYQLGVYDTKFFLPEYAARNSVVWEQILNLSVTEKRLLLKSLLTNYEPENRIYRYNFIFDNCATRPRDKILSSLNGFVRFRDNTDSKTFRQWVGVYVGNDTWLKFGIDLVFGVDADRFTTTSESQFLPENLMEELQTAEKLTTNNEKVRLVKERKILIDKKENVVNKDSWVFKPLSLSILIFLIGIIMTINDLIQKRHHVLFDAALQFITGLGGFVLLYLMLISVHPLVKYNLNILWLNPINFFIAFLIWIRPLRIALFFYQIINIGLLVAALIAFTISMQEINIAFFPIIVLLLMRSASWFAITKRKVFKRRNSK